MTVVQNQRQLSGNSVQFISKAYLWRRRIVGKIAESAMEKLAIELLEKQGYRYIYGPSIAPDNKIPERENFEEVILTGRLHRMLTEGIKVALKKKSGQRGDYLTLVDFHNPENNDFLAVNQFTVI